MHGISVEERRILMRIEIRHIKVEDGNALRCQI